MMAILILVITALSVVNDNRAWDELDDMYLMEISGFEDATT
jgi:hypothetical protein